MVIFEVLKMESAVIESLQKELDPLITELCIEANPTQNSRFCHFKYVINIDTRQPANAFQSINRRGQPVITMNVNLLRSLANDDEIAFVIAHEAGHQIKAHILQLQQKRREGAILSQIFSDAWGLKPEELAQLGGYVNARSHSKKFEFEADLLAADITYASGYDPIKGIGYFRRNETGSDKFLSTHPLSKDRVDNVVLYVQSFKK